MIDADKIGSRQRTGEALITGVGVATPVIAAILDIATRISSEEHPILSLVVEAVSTNILFLYLGLLFLFMVGKFLARSGRKVIWLTLQAQIDTLANIAFPNATGALNDHHRVTIFKFRKWCWSRFNWNQLIGSLKKHWLPNSGWLVPVMRSGHTGKNTRAVFLAPDEGRSAEGVVGSCWACDSGVFKDNLPNVTSNTSAQNKEKYRRNTGMPSWMIEEYIANERPLCRSIFALPVRTSTGTRWGVIVFDSQDRDGIDRASVDAAFRTIIEPIGVLLEGI